MKRKFSRKAVWLMILAVLILITAGCLGIQAIQARQDQGPTLQEIVAEKLPAYETDLRDSLASMKTSDDVARYLLNWASSKGIPARQEPDGSIIYEIEAQIDAEYRQQLEDSGQAPLPVIIFCEYDAAGMEDYVPSLAAALTIARNPVNNEAFTVIFSPRQNGRPAGAESLSSTILADNTQVLCIGKSGTYKVATTTGGYRSFVLSDTFTYEKNPHESAYRVTIDGLPAETPDNRIDGGVNPIKALGDVMAQLKSSGLVFDLASFRGGTSADLTPTGAAMTVLVQQTDESRLTAVLDRSIRKYLEKYEEDVPGVSYTYEKVDAPKNILSHGDTETLLSLLYTAESGVYHKDNEGNAVALSNIGRISTKGGQFRMEAAVSSYSGEYLEEMTEAFRTIAGLGDAAFQTTCEYPIYSGGGAATALLASFQTAVLDFTGWEEVSVTEAAELSPCAILAEKQEGLALIWIGVTEKTKDDFAGAIIDYLDLGKAHHRFFH